MKPGPLGGTPRETIAFAVLLLFLALCFLGGGASRMEVTSLLYLRPAAVIVVAAFVLLLGARPLGPLRVPVLLLAAFAGLMALQLVPLPPDLWWALPGRDRYREAAELMGGAERWRPLSLTPDLTLNSLATLLFPLAGLLGLAAIGADSRRRLVPVLIGGACVSALFGIAQAGGDAGGWAFLYRVTHEASSVGLFANRNHQAALLAMMFPMLRAWTLMPHPDAAYRRIRYWLAGGLALLVLPLLLITGSRAGILLGVIGIAGAYILAPVKLGRHGRTILWSIFVVVPAVLAAGVVLLGRGVAIERLISPSELANEARLEYAPATFAMARDFAPWGTGFGAFDATFRGYETDDSLTLQYLNHAHNDLLELAINGGIPALLLLLAFLFWFIAGAWRAFRAAEHGSALLCARLGGVMIAMLFLASLVDYPLRTPLLALVFAIACGWLALGSEKGPARIDVERDEAALDR